MKLYSSIVPGVFRERLNRFTARVEIQGQTESVHVKNTGRLRELLLPGAPVFLQHCEAPQRKTAYDLISVRRQDGALVNIDSQSPNKVLGEYLPRLFPDQIVRPEYTWEDSRFDFKVGDRVLIEVKGVTLLENEGVARFPDAPTIRGVKHIEGLIRAKSSGWDPYIVFVLAMKGARYFAPNDATHPEFGNALRRAEQAGVRILAFDCLVTSDSLTIDQPVPVKLTL